MTAFGNPYERSRRLEKATALANVASTLVAKIHLASDVEDELPRGPDEAADALENLIASDQHWEELARRAGVKPPSRSTRELVVELLRKRAQVTNDVRRNHPLGPGACDWTCGRKATITLRAADKRWYRCCGLCWRSLGTHANACMARTIQGGG